MNRAESEWYQKGYTADWWDNLPRHKREEFLAALNDNEAERYFRDWRVWAHDYQIPPETDWDTWLFLAGRGAGKTRSAVEYIQDAVNQGWARRIAIVGQGEDDVRNVMVMGQSGFIACAPSWNKPTFKPSVGGGQVIWPNGCVAYIYSIADTEALRGPQFHLGWCDEPMAAPRVQRERALDNLEFCLRLGEHPQLILTTTPKKDPWLTAMVTQARDPENKIHVSRATTHENARNLAANFLKKIERKYRGTRLGRQEIDGEILADEEGALWTEDLINECRFYEGVDLEGVDIYEFAEACDKVVVGIDPNTKDKNGKATKTIHAAGVIVVGSIGKHRFVLADRSVGGGPNKWGKAAVDAAIEFDADEFVAEGNQGGDMIKIVIEQAKAAREEPVNIPIHIRHTGKKDKTGRAEPVATMYAKKLIHHVGPRKALEKLETQMCYLHEGDDPTGEDFDRNDGMVWGMTRLGLRKLRGRSGSAGFGIVTFKEVAANGSTLEG